MRGRARWRSSWGATAAATAATWCTRGSRCCSWAWPGPRRSRISATCACRRASGSPPTATRSPTCGRPPSWAATAPARARRSPSARCWRCARATSRFTLRPSRNFYPSRDMGDGAIGRFFEGEATSEVDVRWGLRRDLWAAVRPDISALDGPIREANRRFGDSDGNVQAIAIAAIAESLPARPPAGRVPHDRLAAGVVDLDRRRHRAAGRADRRLAHARGAPAAGALAVRGPPRARAHARIGSARWSTP